MKTISKLKAVRLLAKTICTLTCGIQLGNLCLFYLSGGKAAVLWNPFSMIVFATFIVSFLLHQISWSAERGAVAKYMS